MLETKYFKSHVPEVFFGLWFVLSAAIVSAVGCLFYAIIYYTIKHS